ncbi:hypothetical protein [Consotaella aegiceratis]|uniref:hypothetical protein n=1 Tax=Consotaella aegiceratis TaxID=3097961 RepID=UPI002F42DBE2
MDFPQDLKLDPADIEARGVLRDESIHKIRSRVGVLMSLYFLEGWRQDKRKGLLDCLLDYLGFFAENVTHFQAEERGYRRWSKDGLPKPYRGLDQIRDDEEFWYAMKSHEAEESDDPSLWRIFAFGFARTNKNRPLSGLKTHFPKNDRK